MKRRGVGARERLCRLLMMRHARWGGRTGGDRRRRRRRGSERGFTSLRSRYAPTHSTIPPLCTDQGAAILTCRVWFRVSAGQVGEGRTWIAARGKDAEDSQ
eukprot:1430931-Rhodomonas_salina.1